MQSALASSFIAILGGALSKYDVMWFNIMFLRLLHYTSIVHCGSFLLSICFERKQQSDRCSRNSRAWPLTRLFVDLRRRVADTSHYLVDIVKRSLRRRRRSVDRTRVHDTNFPVSWPRTCPVPLLFTAAIRRTAIVEEADRSSYTNKGSLVLAKSTLSNAATVKCQFSRSCGVILYRHCFA